MSINSMIEEDIDIDNGDEDPELNTPRPSSPENDEYNDEEEGSDSSFHSVASEHNTESSTHVSEFEDDSDRVKKNIPPIPRKPLGDDDVFTKDGKPILSTLQKHFLREGRLEYKTAVRIIKMAAKVFEQEPNLLRLHDPITVCGDLHGQFYDMMRLLQVGGDPAEVQYLFLGDYVDRGCFSCEVVLYLFSIKINCPDSFFLLRGNHECRHLTSFFNFRDECIFKYSIELYHEFMDAFDFLPLAASVNDKFLCMHGGLSPDITELNEINEINRFQEVPREGPMCDLLWSDPFDENQEHTHKKQCAPLIPDDETSSWFTYNETRQCSFVFGVDAVSTFLKANKLTAVVRAHEAQLEGYRMQMQNSHGVPRVITIFSAPNYCDVYRNKGACLKFDNDLLNIRQFMSSEHPYFLPNFMDVFSWSLPFVAEKVTDMLASVVNIDQDSSDSDFSDEDKDQTLKQSSILQQRGHVFKEKVLAVSRLVRMYKTLRQQNDLVVQLKQLTPNKMLPLGLLHKGSDAIKKAVSNFENALETDKPNECCPPMKVGDDEEEDKPQLDEVSAI